MLCPKIRLITCPKQTQSSEHRPNSTQYRQHEGGHELRGFNTAPSLRKRGCASLYPWLLFSLCSSGTFLFLNTPLSLHKNLKGIESCRSHLCNPSQLCPCNTIPLSPSSGFDHPLPELFLSTPPNSP